MSDPAHAQPPPPPEPRTPLWLPAVGAALFALAGIGWALDTEKPPPPPAEDAPTAVAVKAAAPAPAPTPAPPAVSAMPRHPLAVPAASASGQPRPIVKKLPGPPPGR